MAGDSLGFQLHPRKSCLVRVTDLLHRMENEAVRIGLHVNAKKTEIMTYNLDRPNNQLKSINDGSINEGGWRVAKRTLRTEEMH